jgi:hypothetical protein
MPPISSPSNIWPIQVASPNPIQWKAWSKQYGTDLLGMPLWNIEEPIEGYAFDSFPPSAINPGHLVR